MPAQLRYDRPEAEDATLDAVDSRLLLAILLRRRCALVWQMDGQVVKRGEYQPDGTQWPGSKEQQTGGRRSMRGDEGKLPSLQFRQRAARLPLSSPPPPDLHTGGVYHQDNLLELAHSVAGKPEEWEGLRRGSQNEPFTRYKAQGRAFCCQEKPTLESFMCSAYLTRRAIHDINASETSRRPVRWTVFARLLRERFHHRPGHHPDKHAPGRHPLGSPSHSHRDRRSLECQPVAGPFA